MYTTVLYIIYERSSGEVLVILQFKIIRILWFSNKNGFQTKFLILHTDLFFCFMLHAQNLFYIHILYTQKGVYSIFEYKTSFEHEAFRFSMKKMKSHFDSNKSKKKV